MITLRPAASRGHANHGWLDSRHSFSFGEYHDPEWMGFRSLRVINDDRVAPGMGFGTHPHRDMEIITYVLNGELEHKDSMGNGRIIRAGEVQYMAAGTGVRHSEFNHSKSETCRLLQIWLMPERKGITPGYEQKNFPVAERQGRLRLVGSHDGRDGSVTIQQDVSLYAGILQKGDVVDLSIAAGRHAWVQIVVGAVTINGTALTEGDGAAVSDTRELKFVAQAPTELLVFDLA